MTTIKPRLACGIIILFHLVGLVGLALPVSRPLFLQIVPFHLLLMLAIIFFSHQSIDGKFLLFAVIKYIAGYVAEWLGVHGYWLFGNYAYGPTLGTKLFGIPLTIGINWFLLIYGVGVSLQRSRLKSLFARVAIGAVIMVLLDLLIEPVAIKLDYWQWQDNIIPFKNYLCWYLLSFILLYIFEAFKFKKQSIVGPVLILVEFVFFGVLNVFI